MTYDPTQDEQLTAYALGELGGEQAEAAEKKIAMHPEARAYVEDVRRTAALIGKELKAEPAVSLTPHQTRRIDRAMVAGPGRMRLLPRVLALAAAVALAATIWFAMDTADEPSAPPTRFSAVDSTPPRVALAPAAANRSAEPKQVLPLELPNPAFAGTPKEPPQNVRMKDLTGRDRDPYMLPASIVKEIKNVAREKPITSSDPAPLIGDLEQVTDGDKEPLDGRWVELAPGSQWVQIDLGRAYELFAIVIWHQHLEARVYRDVVVQVSSDADFLEGVTTVFNNDHDNTAGMGQGQDYEYFENYEGLLVPTHNDQFVGTTARYIRCYSKGSTSDDANHYTEVEAWGRPAGAKPPQVQIAQAEPDDRLGQLIVRNPQGSPKPQLTPAQPDQAPLPVELPNPAFAGTPKEIAAGVRVRVKTDSKREFAESGLLAGGDEALQERLAVRNGLGVPARSSAPPVVYYDEKDAFPLSRKPDSRVVASSRPIGGSEANLGGGKVIVDDYQYAPVTPPGAPQVQELLQRNNPNFNTEAYDSVTDNAFQRVLDQPLSTFSIDVDTASYANVRRFITMGQLPPKGAVRIEELVNYFPYYYAPGNERQGEHPFIANIEVAGCPWNGEHRLVRVGLQAKAVDNAERPPSNLVFLLDVSGSMNEPNKLPLVQESMRMLVKELGENDRVAMVVYAGASGLVLDSTPCHRKAEVLAAIDRLQAGGSTNGGAGIELAYKVAAANYIKGGTNRVILATDGDFNVGVTDRSSLATLIEEKRKTGVFLSVLGFGMGNLKDGTMEELSRKGNGNYAYIDSLREARKVLVEQMGGTLVAVAKDVKLQVEFNPARVASYRLIGYENRVLAKEDFNDDKKDAGEIGAGHTVTALYEVVPAGKQPGEAAPVVDELKYQRKPATVPAPVEPQQSDDLLTLKLRYKQPDGDVSTKVEYPVKDEGRAYGRASGDFKFAASVAAFGMILRDSPHKGSATLDAVLELAQEGVGEDKGGYRTEFLDLVRRAKQLIPATR